MHVIIHNVIFAWQGFIKVILIIPVEELGAKNGLVEFSIERNRRNKNNDPLFQAYLS